MRFLVLSAWIWVCLGAWAAEENVPPPPRLTPVPVHSPHAGPIDLCGKWRFSPAPPEQFWQSNAETGAGWADIEVPGEWVMQGFATAERGATTGYVRHAKIPAAWKGQRIKLRFDGVYSEAGVYVNGRQAGAHAGGFTPFELDVTDLVQPGSDATVAVAVRAETLADELASGCQYAAHSLGGIVRKAYLFAVPELNLASLHVETTFDDNGRDATLSLITRTANEGKVDAKDLALRVDLDAPDGRRLKLDLPLVPLKDIRAGASLACRAGLPIPAPESWDAEHPRLYTLHCTLLQGDKEVETVSKRFGFREVEVRENQLFVNNRPVKLRGSCRHETHPLRGRSLTPELWRKDAELFRAANVNYVRTSHYPPAEEFIEACDELGIFVEEEAPICWLGHPAGSATLQQKASQEEVRDLIVQQTLETVQRDRSHPSVIIWSLANESKWGPAFELSLKAANKLDPTRPKSFHDQAWGEYNHAVGTNVPIAVYH
jgi:beta-galactosidase/beta-glucuronidase